MSGDLVAGLLRFDAAFKEALLRGMSKAGAQLLDDSINQIPSVPLDEGTLRGSGAVHVQGKHEMSAPNVGGDPTPYTDNFDAPGSLIVEAIISFNTPYAAALHEGEWKSGPNAGKNIHNYNERGTGAKYLERAMSENRNSYMETVSDEIGKVMR